MLIWLKNQGKVRYRTFQLRSTARACPTRSRSPWTRRTCSASSSCTRPTGARSHQERSASNIEENKTGFFSSRFRRRGRRRAIRVCTFSHLLRCIGRGYRASKSIMRSIMPLLLALSEQFQLGHGPERSDGDLLHRECEVRGFLRWHSLRAFVLLGVFS